MPPDHDIPESIKELLYAERHRLLEDDLGRAVRNLIDHDVADGFVRNMVSERVRKHKTARAFAGPIDLPKLNTGRLVLGLDNHQGDIRCPLSFLNGHSLTLGGSGCGKTHRSRFMALQIATQVGGLWLFDLRKKEYAALQPLMARLGIDLVVVDIRQLKLNPLQCPVGVEPADWAPRVADMLVLVLQLPPRAAKLIHATIFELYNSFGVLAGGDHYPTMFDLREAIRSNSEANAQAKQAFVDSIDPVLLSLREALCFRKGWSTSDLASRHWVLEMAGASEVDKDLMLNSLVLHEFTSRVARGVSNPQMDLYICCDEAARMVSSSNPRGGIADLIGLIRGTGIGLDLSIQSADLAPSILSNTANKFVGRCGSASDYQLIAGSMGLDREQCRWMQHHLAPGWFVGQVGEGNWRYPFVVRIPKMKLAACPPTGFQSSDPFADLPVDVADEFVDWSPNRVAQVSTDESTTTMPTLDSVEIRYLEVIIKNPGLPSSSYPKLAGLGPQKAQRIRKKLIDAGYLIVHRVNTGGRGRNAIVLEPLETAFVAVGVRHGQVGD